MIIAAVFYILSYLWVSTFFAIGYGFIIFLLLKSERKNQTAPYRYRRSLWGNYFQRFLIQIFPPFLALCLFILIHAFSQSLLYSYVFSIAGGFFACLFFPSLFSLSLGKCTSTKLDKLCKGLPFQFKEKRIIEIPEDIPILNAWVSGILNPVLVVTTSLLDCLDEKELEAVLYHEAGHVIGKHLVYLSIYTIFCVPSLLLLSYAGYSYIMTILFIAILLSIFWMRHLLESKADIFCVKNMENGGIYLISALEKMTSINKKTVLNTFGKKVDKSSKSLTHPTIGKREKNIKQYLLKAGK